MNLHLLRMAERVLPYCVVVLVLNVADEFVAFFYR